MTSGSPAIAALVGAMILGVTSIDRQQPNTPQAPQAPVFRTRADLLTLTVSVVDSQGRPVRDLTSGDFIVRLNGQPRPVRAVSYYDFGRRVESSAEPKRGDAPAAVQTPASSGGGRVIMLVVDDISAKPFEMTGLRTSADAFLGTLDIDDMVGVVTTSGLGPAIDPTRDRAAVRRALASPSILGRYDEISPALYVSVPEAIEIHQAGARALARSGSEIEQGTTFGKVVLRECLLYSAPNAGRSGGMDANCDARVANAANQLFDRTRRRVDQQLAAYRAVIDALRSAPAPRVAIVFSTGVAVGVDGVSDGLKAISESAATAGVQLYALSSAPAESDVTDIGQARAEARRAEERYLEQGVEAVAEAAGGKAFSVNGQADRFLARIAAETSGVYELGVELSPTAVLGQGFNVDVRVNRPHLSVRTNRRAVAADSNPQPSTASPGDPLAVRLAQGGSVFAVPLQCAVFRRAVQANRAVELGVAVRVPGAIRSPLRLQFALLDAHGFVVRSGRQDLQQRIGDDYWTTFALPVVAGDYRLRVGVVDPGGRIGAVEQSVTADLPQAGTRTTSDLFVAWSGGGGIPVLLSGEQLPGTVTVLHVSLELYGPAERNSRLHVKLAILREGTAAPLAERDLLPTSSGGTLTAAGQLPIDRLEPGHYIIRATVLDGSTVLGSLARRVAKE